MTSHQFSGISRHAARIALTLVCGTALIAQQADRPTAPVGVIPGAPAGSPDQAPDSSNFNYSTLFHELKPDDTAGFTQIFDGKTLTGWDGDPLFWRVENGSIVGESTPQNRVAQNTFLIWRGERLRDFELKIDFRILGTNSGVQVRSVELPSVGKWVLKGYQADMDFINGFTGNIHEERGRDLLVPRGQVVRVVDGPAYKSVGRIAPATDLRGVVNVANWNRYHIIARGPMLLQLLNGQLMAVLIDDDSANRALEGVLGLQMHVGDPFKVEFRNVWYKKL
jgi:3-keto-disaccharide hydrolase